MAEVRVTSGYCCPARIRGGAWPVGPLGSSSLFFLTKQNEENKISVFIQLPGKLKPDMKILND